MLRTATYPNVADAAALAKKRLLEEQRKERVFDPKARTIGVDKLALDRQVEEKRSLQRLEQDRDAYFDGQTVAMDQHAVFLQQQSERMLRDGAKDVELYRKQFQSKQAAREWDLNDPRRVTEALPARIGDSDPRCGVSSLQQFAGEDLAGLDRKVAQQRQLREWATTQAEEKRARELAEHEHDRQVAERFEELNHRAWQAELAGKDLRRAADRATAEFNQRLAEQKRRELLGEKRKETMDNWEEIRNQLDSDLLTENLDSTLNATNPSRFKRYHMKGLLPEHRQAILNEQAAQREELLKRKEKEAEEERAWAMAALKTGATLTAVEEEIRRQRAQANLQLREDQQRQAAVQADQRRRLDATYRNEVTEDFFGKFNQNSR